MLDYTYIEKYNINFLCAREPFSLQELLQLLKTPREADDPSTRNGPVIMDFRQVQFERMKMPDIRRHLMKKANVGGADFFCAYVMGSPEATSVLRTANGFSGLTGVTQKEKTFVTEEFTEAVTWISEILQENKFAVYRELQSLALSAAQPHGAV